jgi:excisionase family DNA binding protein
MDARTSDWLTVGEAAQHARCGKSLIYGEVQRGRLRAARLGGRRELRFLATWIDAWLLATSTPVVVNPGAPGDEAAAHRIDSPTH